MIDHKEKCMLRRIFRLFLKCKDLKVYKSQYERYTVCQDEHLKGAINPDMYGQCKHCEHWK